MGKLSKKTIVLAILTIMFGGWLIHEGDKARLEYYGEQLITKYLEVEPYSTPVCDCELTSEVIAENDPTSD